MAAPLPTSQGTDHGPGATDGRSVGQPVVQRRWYIEGLADGRPDQLRILSRSQCLVRRPSAQRGEHVVGCHRGRAVRTEMGRHQGTEFVVAHDS
jgi:hypothetical protein